MRVPFVDLQAQQREIGAAINLAIEDVLTRCDFILGAAVERFEADYARFIGTRHAIGVGTGLDAIELALRAHGIGPGDEVITAANTFIATVLAIEAAGARPVLVDADRDTYAIDPAAITAAVGPRTRAIIPVHLYGQPVDTTCWSSRTPRRRTAPATRAGAQAVSGIRRRSAFILRKTSARAAMEA